MRIGLNATPFNDRPSGARQRFIGIYGALVRQRPDWTFVIYEPTDCRVATWFDGAPNVVARATPIASTGRWQRVVKGATYWRRTVAADRLDVYENFVLPVVRPADVATVLTIHDIRPLYENVGLAGRMMRRHVLHRAFANVDRVVTVSDAVRDEILAFHPGAQVSTVYNGVNPACFSAPADDTIAMVRARYGLPPRYLFAIGHLEARKNLPLLVDAIALLRDRGMPHHLVIAGNDGGDRAAILARVAAHGVAPLVTLIEKADDAAVRALYAGCEMLVFPSCYEGFGIPILEAMAADKPMVLSNTAVFRELTQGQGLYFSVDDAPAAADVIERVWSDPAERERQLRYGRTRVRDFGFDRLAGQMAAIYETLA